jgi:hypothetical protein
MVIRTKMTASLGKNKIQQFRILGQAQKENDISSNV